MSSSCPFCEITNHDVAQRIITQNELAFVMRDGYPITEGHTLIIPKRHISSFFEITDEERRAMLGLLDQAQKEINQEFNPDAYNIGINDGPAAESTIQMLLLVHH